MSHSSCHNRLIERHVGDRLISRFGPVNWPPRSCDLTPLDYFLWGYVKSLVYADKPQTLDHLEDNIRRVIADIRPQMLEKVIENWTSRLDYIRASRGSPMPEIIFKITNENLDDLLNLEPLPNSPFLSKKSEKSEPEQIDSEPPKPVPLPRKKSLGIVETEQPPKPEVRPRKVFLNKSDTPSQDQNQKPQPPVRPPVPAKPSMPKSSKPAPPPKPKPPPKKPKPTIQKENKTEDLDAANANEPGETENMNTVSGLAEDLKELDILKYIEQEEKSVDAQLNLFD
ncbi:hypothetical protein TNCV_2007601 [Trichonephila clavipes]|nr:hypothetical protein TNCV_2007601 [Trichonephila clavipes]